jgi:hypothetical protein
MLHSWDCQLLTQCFDAEELTVECLLFVAGDAVTCIVRDFMRVTSIIPSARTEAGTQVRGGGGGVHSCKVDRHPCNRAAAGNHQLAATLAARDIPRAGQPGLAGEVGAGAHGGEGGAERAPRQLAGGDHHHFLTTRASARGGAEPQSCAAASAGECGCLFACCSRTGAHVSCVDSRQDHG